MFLCDICGNDAASRFVCRFCRGMLCAERRLPEHHSCRFLPETRSGEPQVKHATQQTGKKNEDDTSMEPIPKEESPQPPCTDQPRTRSRTIAVLCVLLVAVPLIAGYFTYNLGFGLGSKTFHIESYNSGYRDGNLTGYGLGFTAGNASGFEIGYSKGVNDGAGAGFTVRDPTYQEMLAFIENDTTDKNEYNETDYACWNFAADVKNNAFEEGYRCGFVYVAFPSLAHATICFRTVDKGLIFIEPQDDEIVPLVIGQYYWNRSRYTPPDYDDTVTRYEIAW